MTFFDPHHERETVQLFIYNLLWGKVRIEYEKFGSKDEGLRYADEIYKNIDLWDGESLCPSLEHEATVNKIVTQLDDAIIKGRTYGAIIGELHDKGYEARIQEFFFIFFR